jgi:hypothetical protein
VTGRRQAERLHYTLIAERSAVLLSVGTSLGPISFGALGLEGFIEAAVLDGEIDPTAPPTAHVELQVARLTSGNSAYDGELRRQIDARRFPTAYVDLHQAVPLDEASRTFRVTGEITLRGVTEPAEGVVVAELTEPGALVVSGEETLNISDFGIPPPALFMIKIDPDVKLHLHVEGRGAPA